MLHILLMSLRHFVIFINNKSQRTVYVYKKIQVLIVIELKREKKST